MQCPFLRLHCCRFQRHLVKEEEDDAADVGARRQFRREFKVETVKRVTEQGLAGAAQTARDVDVHVTRLSFPPAHASSCPRPPGALRHRMGFACPTSASTPGASVVIDIWVSSLPFITNLKKTSRNEPMRNTHCKPCGHEKAPLEGLCAFLVVNQKQGSILTVRT